jgi:hypothetical protein
MLPYSFSYVQHWEIRKRARNILLQVKKNMVFILDRNNFFCHSLLAMEGNLPDCRSVRYRAVGFSSSHQLAFQLRSVGYW